MKVIKSQDRVCLLLLLYLLSLTALRAVIMVSLARPAPDLKGSISVWIWGVIRNGTSSGMGRMNPEPKACPKSIWTLLPVLVHTSRF